MRLAHHETNLHVQAVYGQFSKYRIIFGNFNGPTRLTTHGWALSLEHDERQGQCSRTAYPASAFARVSEQSHTDHWSPM